MEVGFVEPKAKATGLVAALELVVGMLHKERVSFLV